MTQVINSLLALLVFPVEKEEQFFQKFSDELFPKASCPHCGSTPPDLEGACSQLRQRFAVSSLNVAKFGACANVSRFFKRLRNAIAHKNLSFSGPDPDSKSVKDVIVILKDTPRGAKDFDWEISMTAEDLETLGRFVAREVISLGL